MIDAVAPVNELYGDSPADEFGPLKLKTLRQHLVEHGLCRTEINKRVGRIKRVFKWAVSEELISPSTHCSFGIPNTSAEFPICFRLLSASLTKYV